jgi:gas vesicle protein|nr:MAG: hypothetical protein KatS3mg041_1215 [Bacteroidota bacterium]
MARGSFSRGFLFGALAGGVVAAMAVLLLTPTTGERLRRRLVYRLSRLIEDVQDQLDRMRQVRSEPLNEARIRDRALVGELEREAEAISQEMQGLMQQLQGQKNPKRYSGRRDMIEGVAPTG